MELENLFKCFIEGYYGIREMDEYDLKEYILKDVENYIKDFVNTNNMDKKICTDISKYVVDNVEIKTKLQSSLIVLNKLNASMEIILLIKKRLKKLENENI